MYTLETLFVLLIPVVVLCLFIVGLSTFSMFICKFFGDQWGYVILCKLSGLLLIALAIKGNILLLGIVGGGLVAIAYIFGLFLTADYLKVRFNISSRKG